MGDARRQVRRARPGRCEDANRLDHAARELCKTNEANVIAFIYGGDDEATEVLLEQVVAAVCEVVGGKCEMPLWRWVTQEADQAGRILRTELIELNVTLRLPVASEIKPLRAIVSVDDTCGLMAGTEDEWTIGEEA